MRIVVQFGDEPKLEMAIHEEGTEVEFSNDSGMPREVWDSVELVILRSSAKSCITLASPLPIYTQGKVAPYTVHPPEGFSRFEFIILLLL